MKRTLMRLAALALIPVLFTACGGRDGGRDGGGDNADALRLMTGDEQGTYFAFGSVLAGYASDRTDTAVTALISAGSQANVEALADGSADLGFVQSDVMAYAFNGTRLFDAPETGFSTVAALYMEQVQIVTLDPEIQSVSDLAGKAVCVGDAGSGVNFNAVDILGVYELDLETDITPVYESFGGSVESLRNGAIDAAIVVAGAPTTAVSTLAGQEDVRLISLDSEHVDQLMAVSPYYSKALITADTYNLAADVSTVAVGAVVIARDDVPEKQVYDFVSAVFENAESITAAHARGAELDLDFAASVTSVPYHPGAARYFKEKGLEVPTK